MKSEGILWVQQLRLYATANRCGLELTDLVGIVKLFLEEIPWG